MIIQSLGQVEAQGVRRQDLASGPLGRVGNLQFRPEQGGTARTAHASAAYIGGAWGALRLRLGRATSPEREQRDFLKKVQVNSLRVGDMLGRLTAPADDPKSLINIARKLKRLGNRAQGDLSSLPGGLEALFTYAGELTRPDLDALRTGALGNAQVRSSVLHRISPVLRHQAAAILDQIAEAVNQRWAQEVVHAPLRQIGNLMFDLEVNGRALAERLIDLSIGLGVSEAEQSPDVPLLSLYFRSLSQDQLEEASSVFQAGIMDFAQQALWRLDNALDRRRALRMLACIRAHLGSEIGARVRVRFEAAERALIQARHADDPFAGSQALRDLDVLVAEVRQTYGWLPEEVAATVRRLVNDSLILYRDPAFNRDGPLNSASLSGLDGATRANLRNAWCLRPLGLELEELVDAGWRSS